MCKESSESAHLKISCLPNHLKLMSSSPGRGSVEPRAEHDMEACRGCCVAVSQAGRGDSLLRLQLRSHDLTQCSEPHHKEAVRLRKPHVLPKVTECESGVALVCGNIIGPFPFWQHRTFFMLTELYVPVS